MRANGLDMDGISIACKPKVTPSARKLEEEIERADSTPHAVCMHIPASDQPTCIRPMSLDPHQVDRGFKAALD